jgi:hypothetical protein
MREMRYSRRILLENLKRRNHLCRGKWGDDIKMDIKEIE